jgi:hypothetical protein
MNKTLTAMVLTGALALTACGDKPLSKVTMPESAYKTKAVFRVSTFEPRTSLIVGYDTDGDPRTIEEVIVVRNRTYNISTPDPADLEALPREDWDHLVAPGVAPKRYVTDHTSTMTPAQRDTYNGIAALANFK